MFGFLRKAFGRGNARGARPRGGDRPRAGYDAAQTTDENRRHWANADSYDANAVNTPDVRQRLRNRARYEEANNSYLRGLIRAIANDMVGTGPRLQLRLEDRTAARLIEKRFRKWCRSIGLAEKLRLMQRSQYRDGESFGVLVSNPKLDPLGVQLDVRLYEADQVATPDLFMESPEQVDGIKFDEHGNPVEYHLLRIHPGAFNLSSFRWDYQPLPAASVIHWFQADRAGQARGIPHVASALPLFAQLRRYTLATIGAAELSASIAAVMKTNQPPPDDGEDEDADGPELMQRIHFDRVTLLTLPHQWDANPFDAKQPINTYAEFKGEIIDESGRGLQAPSIISRGNATNHTYSGGRLEHLGYHRSLTVERSRMGATVCDRLFGAWLDEAYMIPGYLPEGLPPVADWEWEWFWDGFGSIDPVKDATANQLLLASGQTSMAKVAAQGGDDWEELFDQQAREMRRRQELGLPQPGAVAPAATQPGSPVDQQDGQSTDGAPQEEYANAV